MDIKSFFKIQMACLGFIIRYPLVVILWLLLFSIPWFLLILLINMERPLSWYSIVGFFLFSILFIVCIPWLSRFSTSFYFKKLGVITTKSTEPISAIPYMTILNLVNKLTPNQKTQWSKFFQLASLFNLCVIALFFGIMFADTMWWIVSFMLTGAYIMPLYTIYAILLYALVTQLPLPNAPQILQNFVKNMQS